MPKDIYINNVGFEKFNHFLIFELKWADKKSTIAPRKYVLNSFKKYFHDLPFNRVNFASYIAEQKIAGYKNSTVNRKISYGMALAKYLGVPDFENMTYFPEHRAKAKDILTWKDMDKISTARVPYLKKTLDKHTTVDDVNYRYYCLIRLLSETGCRIGEALDLKWNNIDGSVLTFEDTKNGETRNVIVTDQLASELLNLPRRSSRVLSINSTSGAAAEVKRRAKIAGIKKRNSVSPHLFRHSVITNLVMSGAPIKVVMEMVGHKRLETTAGYINNTLADMENMLYMYSGLWESRITAKTFLSKAHEMVSKLLTNQSHRIKLGDEGKYYLIKIPKNAFTN